MNLENIQTINDYSQVGLFYYNDMLHTLSNIVNEALFKFVSFALFRESHGRSFKTALLGMVPQKPIARFKISYSPSTQSKPFLGRLMETL